MKDLIAKQHSNAADQILATFATLEMQIQGFAKSSYEKDLRIAELEAQIAGASAPVVEQQPIGYIPKWAHDMLTGEMGGMSDWGCNAHIYAAEAIGHIPIYTAPRITDPDKLRGAILALRVDPPRHYDNAQISAFCLGAKVMSEAAADLAASTALQAPVREVPGWISVEDRLPDSDPDKRVWATWTGAGNIELGPRQGEARFVASMGWQPIGHMGWDWNVSHWQPLPALAAAPVQQEGE